MKRATVRDLRYAFPKVESALADGESIEIVKRNKVVATLVPVSAEPKPRPPMPDFMARLNAIWGDRILEPSTAELLAEERDRF